MATRERAPDMSDIREMRQEATERRNLLSAGVLRAVLIDVDTPPQDVLLIKADKTGRPDCGMLNAI
jgi:phosphopantetheinyl transferase